METRPPSDSGPSAQDPTSLGELLAEFHPPLARRLLVFACGLALLASGGLLAVLQPGRRSAFGLFLVAAGGFVLALAWRLARQRVLLHAGGIVRVQGEARQACRWEDVAEIVEGQARGKGVTVPDCRLVRRDGSSLSLTDLTGSPYPDLVATLHPWAESQGIPWKRGPVALGGGDALRWLLYGLITLATLVLVLAALALWLLA